MRVPSAFAVACAAMGITVAACASEAATPATSVEDQLAAVPYEFTAVLGSIVGERTAPVLGNDGRYHVVYEVVLTNSKPVEATIERLDVVDAADTDRVVASLDTAEVFGEGRTLGGGALLEGESPTLNPEDTILTPNESIVVMMHLEFDSLDEIPEQVLHRLVGTGAVSPAPFSADIDYLFAPFAINTRASVELGAPLRGDGWVVVNGCCTAAGAHRGSIQTLAGQLWDAQRFAIDWIKIGDNGTFADGDIGVAENWYSYAEPVYAVADGTVVDVLDELPDQEPGELPDPSTITIETVDGNHVVLKVAEGVYVFYAHLSLGSVTVEVGDEVKAGDTIGLLGNSGNTSGPHLHMHLMTNERPLAADGIPYEFTGVTTTGRLDRAEWEAADILDPKWTVSSVPDDPDGYFLPLDLSVVTMTGPDGE